MKKYIILILVLAVFLTAFLFWPQNIVEDKKTMNNSNIEFIEIFNDIALSEEKIIKDVLLDVPFTSQAPFGDWSNNRYQDGCEEACVIMADVWLQNKVSLTVAEAQQAIYDLSLWEEENYGSYVDTSVQDTAKRLLGEYYDYSNYEVREIEKVEEIIYELNKNNLVIVPTDGKKLANPNFTAPGPERHMLVVKGYDGLNKQFITNDPGTRLGENWRYHQDHLFRSIRDYPTGDHLQINSIEKNIIVIFK